MDGCSIFSSVTGEWTVYQSNNEDDMYWRSDHISHHPPLRQLPKSRKHMKGSLDMELDKMKGHVQHICPCPNTDRMLGR